MRAARFHTYGEADVLQIDQIDPPLPAPTEVLIHVRSSSLNAADLGARRGITRLIHRHTLPHIPGFDVAGEIVACGRAVTAFVPGERVYGLIGTKGGAHAEYACMDQTTLARVPHTISLTEAGAVPLAALTALQALRGKAQLRPGQRVLVTGAAGGVGTFAVQIAKLFHCHVTAVCRGAHAALVRSIGADEVIDYQRDDWTTRPTTWDVVMDTAGQQPFRDARRVLAPGGIMVTARVNRQDLPVALLPTFGPGPHVQFVMTKASGLDLALISTLIDDGKLQPVIDQIYPLDQIVAAHRRMEAGGVGGKIVIQVAEAAPSRLQVEQRARVASPTS